MSTSELVTARFESTRTFRNNARFYAPVHLTKQLGFVACAPTLALVVDVDALQRSALATERVMLLALEALSYVNVQVVVVSRDHQERAQLLHHAVARSWCLERADALACVRDRIPGVRMVVITDEPRLLAELSDDDRGIRMSCDEDAVSTNVLVAGDIEVRAALWWLVDARTKAQR
jgi:hypothetical protein